MQVREHCRGRWIETHFEVVNQRAGGSIGANIKVMVGEQQKSLQASQPLPVSHVHQGAHGRITCPCVQKSYDWHSGSCGPSQPSLTTLMDRLWSF